MTDLTLTAADVLREAGYEIWDPSDEELNRLVEKRRALSKRNTDQQLWTWRPRAENAR